LGEVKSIEITFPKKNTQRKLLNWEPDWSNPTQESNRAEKLLLVLMKNKH